MNKDVPSPTAVVRVGTERMCEDFGLAIAQFGFTRGKKFFWARRAPFTIEFLHLHRAGSSYGSTVRNASVSLRVHSGIRVLQDPFEALALNGPQSTPAIEREGRYHLRFNAETNSTYDRCLTDLLRFVSERSLPWFASFAEPAALLAAPDSPLSEQAKQGLREALAGQVNEARAQASLKLLGAK